MGTYRPLDASLTEHPVKRLRQDLLGRGRCIDLPLAPSLGRSCGAIYRRAFREAPRPRS
jgi:hypothetical protein